MCADRDAAYDRETALAWLRKWVEKNTLPPNREYLLGLIEQAKP